MGPSRALGAGIIALLAWLWVGPVVSSDRGVRFSHAGHQQEAALACTSCHAFGPGQRAMPNHQLCSICHDTLPEP